MTRQSLITLLLICICTMTAATASAATATGQVLYYGEYAGVEDFRWI